MKKLLIVICMLFGIFAGIATAAKEIENGATSQSISVVILDADGDPNTAGVTIANLDLYIQRDGHPQSAKSDLTAHGAVSDAWDDLEAIHLGNGLHRVDIPDANLADGAGTMLTYIIVDAVSHNRTVYYEVQLKQANYFDLVIGSDGLVESNLQEVVDDDVQDNGDGRLEVNVEEIGDAQVPVASAVLVSDGLSGAEVQAESEDALEKFHLDHLMGVTTSVAADGDLSAFVIDGSVLSHIMTVGADTSDYAASTDSLEISGAAATTDQMWDEAASGHMTLGTFGWLLNIIGLLR